MFKSSFNLVLAAVVISAMAMGTGCQFGQIPDPNIVAEQGMPNPEIVNRNLDDMYAVLTRRVQLGEITAEQRDEMIVERAQRAVAEINLEEIPVNQAWRFGDLFRKAEQWETAYQLYSIALDNAPDWDRTVNDSLRKAHMAAHLGRLDEAFELSRSTFEAPPEEKAPILFAVLYEIVPAGRGQGRDGELATLLMEASEQMMETQVDPNSEPGQAFLLTKPHHINMAFEETIRLLDASGETTRKTQAFNRFRRMLDSMGSA